MDIGFIGAGRVGCTIGRYLKERNFNIVGYNSKSRASSEIAARFTDSLSLDIGELVQKCEYIFITTPDDAISSVFNVIKNFDLKEKKVFHMSGSMTSSVFEGIEGCGAYGFSLHPVFPIADKELYEKLSSAIFTIEGKEINKISDFLIASQINYFEIDASCKPKYHAAAVFASNYMVCLGKVAKELFLECGIPEDTIVDALYPLMKCAVDNIKDKGFEDALTGPITRGDVGVVKSHLQSLTDYRDIYTSLGKVAINIAHERGKFDMDTKQLLLKTLTEEYQL
jgi:predicted short-subunit dehydrogenase-like oxidoreductase (DUF2520 family)